MLKKLASVAVFGAIIFITRYFYIGRHCRCRKSLDGKHIIITGANSGIGLATARILATKGAIITLACRNIANAEIQIKLLIESTKNPNIYVEEIDLTSFESILSFSRRIIYKNIPVYALINNAGIFYHNSLNTVNNLEITFQTNYLAPFLLTILLLPALRKYDGNSRIINLSSSAHYCTVRFPQPEYHRNFDDEREHFFKSYQYSKFCLVLFSYKLSNLLKKSNITVHCVDPGNSETNIYRNFPQLSNAFYYYLQKPIRILAIKTPTEGAQSVVHAVVNKNPPFYIKNLKEHTKINKQILIPIFSEVLWLLSRKLCQPYLTI